MKHRYSLCSPVPGGESFWLINDMQKMYAVVSIFKDFPGAEAEIRRLYAKLIEGNTESSVEPIVQP